MGQPVPADDLPPNAVPASDLPSANPVTPTPAGPNQPSQADVRKADMGLVAKAPPRKRAFIPGDVGSLLGAGEAQGAANRAMEHVAYEAGGKVTDAATAMGLPPQAAAGAGYGANVAVGAVPMLLGGKGAEKAAPLLEKGAQRVMQMGLKPSKAARESGEAAQAIEYMLDKGFNVSKGGVEKLTAHIDDLDNQLTAAIQNSANKVSTAAVFQPIKDAIAKFRDGLDHAENSQAIRAEVLKFFNHPNVQQALDIPVQVAQKMKRAIDKELGDKAFTFGAKSSAEQEGKLAVRRGMKEGIEAAEPSAAGVNAEMSKAINARDLAAQRVLQAGNNNLMGLGWLADPSKWIPWLAERSPLAASLTARGLNSGSKAIPRTAGQVAGGTVGAYEETPPRR